MSPNQLMAWATLYSQHRNSSRGGSTQWPSSPTLTGPRIARWQAACHLPNVAIPHFGVLLGSQPGKETDKQFHLSCNPPWE
jgi:hypothetical protein